MLKARLTVILIGNPSGTATTISVIASINDCRTKPKMTIGSILFGISLNAK